MARITLDHLHKRFGKHVAVQDLSLVIEDKELMVFLGPSGCGKTTTLNCVAGLEMPTSGRIRFDDVDVTDVPPHRRDIAMVFQSSLLYPHLTGRQNIRMSLRLAKLSRADEDQRIQRVAEMLSIEHILDRPPSQMSGGERQRTAIAKAIVREPAVFLMDEPFANLDAALREVLRAELAVLQEKLGTTMILVTHDQVEAMTMGDRIAVMCDGRLQQVAKPDDIYNCPATTFVAEFIGSPPMQLFQGTLRRADGRCLFVREGHTLELTQSHAQFLGGLKDGHGLTLGARPQHMTVSGSPEPGAFPARVYTVERLGRDDVVIVIDCEGNKVKVLAPAHTSLDKGSQVYVGIKRENVLLFDTASGKNLSLSEGRDA